MAKKYFQHSKIDLKKSVTPQDNVKKKLFVKLTMCRDEPKSMDSPCLTMLDECWAVEDLTTAAHLNSISKFQFRLRRVQISPSMSQTLCTIQETSVISGTKASHCHKTCLAS